MEQQNVPEKAFTLATSDIEITESADDSSAATLYDVRLLARSSGSIEHWYWGNQTIHDMGGLAAEDDKEGDDIDAGDGDDLVFAGPGDVIRLGGGRDTASLTADPNSGGTTLFRDFTPGEDMIELHMPIDDSGSGSFADYVASRETTEEGTTISLTTGQTLIFEGAHEGIPDDAFTIVHRGLSAA